MDPVTTAIVAAITTGVTTKGAEVVGKAIIDGYNGLKDLLRSKFGGESKLVTAAEELEATPSSEGRKLTLREEVEASGACGDEELRAAAEALLERIRGVPGGEQNIQVAVGSNIAQAGRGGSASVDVRKP